MAGEEQINLVVTVTVCDPQQQLSTKVISLKHGHGQNSLFLSIPTPELNQHNAWIKQQLKNMRLNITEDGKINQISDQTYWVNFGIISQEQWRTWQVNMDHTTFQAQRLSVEQQPENILAIKVTHDLMLLQDGISNQQQAIDNYLTQHQSEITQHLATYAQAAGLEKVQQKKRVQHLWREFQQSSYNQDDPRYHRFLQLAQFILPGYANFTEWLSLTKTQPVQEKQIHWNTEKEPVTFECQNKPVTTFKSPLSLLLTDSAAKDVFQEIACHVEQAKSAQQLEKKWPEIIDFAKQIHPGIALPGVVVKSFYSKPKGLLSRDYQTFVYASGDYVLLMIDTKTKMAYDITPQPGAVAIEHSSDNQFIVALTQQQAQPFFHKGKINPSQVFAHLDNTLSTKKSAYLTEHAVKQAFSAETLCLEPNKLQRLRQLIGKDMTSDDFQSIKSLQLENTFAQLHGEVVQQVSVIDRQLNKIVSLAEDYLESNDGSSQRKKNYRTQLAEQSSKLFLFLTQMHFDQAELMQSINDYVMNLANVDRYYQDKGFDSLAPSLSLLITAKQRNHDNKIRKNLILTCKEHKQWLLGQVEQVAKLTSHRIAACAAQFNQHVMKHDNTLGQRRKATFQAGLLRVLYGIGMVFTFGYLYRKNDHLWPKAFALQWLHNKLVDNAVLRKERDQVEVPAKVLYAERSKVRHQLLKTDDVEIRLKIRDKEFPAVSFQQDYDDQSEESSMDSSSIITTPVTSRIKLMEREENKTEHYNPFLNRHHELKVSPFYEKEPAFLALEVAEYLNQQYGKLVRQTLDDDLFLNDNRIIKNFREILQEKFSAVNDDLLTWINGVTDQQTKAVLTQANHDFVQAIANEFEQYLLSQSSENLSLKTIKEWNAVLQRKVKTWSAATYLDQMRNQKISVPMNALQSQRRTILEEILKIHALVNPDDQSNVYDYQLARDAKSGELIVDAVIDLLQQSSLVSEDRVKQLQQKQTIDIPDLREVWHEALHNAKYLYNKSQYESDLSYKVM